MSKHFTYIFIVFFSLLISASFAQEKLSIGQWQDHLSYRSAQSVTQSDNSVILSTGRAIVFLDKNDLSTQYYNKTDGLSQGVINNIRFDKFNKQLFVFYEDGVFDVLKEDKVITIDAINKNRLITGDKRIKDICFDNANRAFMATKFGIIEFDLKKLEFKSTTFTNLEAFAVASNKDFAYAALEDGLYRIIVNSNQKEAFSKWEFMGSSFGLPSTYLCKNVEIFNNNIYITYENKILFSDGQKAFTELNINRPNGFSVEWLSAEGTHLIVGLKDRESQSTTRFIDKNNVVKDGSAGCINRTRYGIEDEKGRVWYADDYRGIRYTLGINSDCKRLEFDSPYGFDANHIEVGKDRVYFASDGATERYQLTYSRSGIYALDKKDGKWTNINEEFNPEIGNKKFLAFNTICPHPTKDSIFYTGSFFSGLMEGNIATKSFKFWAEVPSNGIMKSSLQGIIGAADQIRVSHMKFDEIGNLWISNTGAPKPISVYTKDGNWFNFSVPGNTLTNKLTIDAQGNKWFGTYGAGASAIVFSDNKTPADPTDDKVKVLNGTNSIITDQVNCVEVDLDGDVWVGTSAGPIVFECNPFAENCIGSRRKVLQDSIPALLLETEEIFAIEIDGANRKWFGTRNGIFVQSADGETEEARFNEENSPLFKNKIIDMDFDPSTGIMYISTDGGIQSIKTNSTGGLKQHDESQVLVYPNPVRPEYGGPIAIKGLVRDADVRITDLNGRLVFKTKANGGQAIWDGRGYDGNKVDTGVYLVFSAKDKNVTEKDALVTKITVVK